jgi:ribosomal protein S7
MVSSTLSPQAIIKSRPATPNSFGSFMTGESSLGNSSSLTEASNKIVKFSNPTVSTVPLDISSLLTNISTNILNQVDNSIKNTTNFIKTDINRDFEKQLNNLRSDIYSKLDEIQNNAKYLQKDVIKTTNEIYQQILNQSPTKIQKDILENIVPQLETRILELTDTTSQSQSQKEILENIVPQLETRILELTDTTSQSQVQPETSVSKIQQTIVNIQEQAKTVLDNTLKSFSQDYQEKIKGFDDKRPNNVLSKFLDLYQNAIGFINFFGDRKNINTVEKNLKSLRVMFEESFEVAKVLRQTIVKIVKQLSNLPSASPSAGGLNLDVNIPGGRLKQAGGPKVRNVGRGAGLGAAAGIGLLGLGGLATAASGMGRAKQYQEEMLASGVEGAAMDQSIPEGFIDTFSNIVDRFTSAIEGLVKGAKSSPGSSSGGGGGGPSPSPGSPGGGGGTAVSSAPGDEKLAAFVASMEASSPENAADAMQVMLNRAASGYSKQGLAGVISGREQFSPLSAAIYGTSADKAAARKYGPIATRLPGNTPQEKFKYLQQVASEPDGLNKLQQIFNGGDPQVAATILNDPKYLEASRKNVRGALNFGAGSIAQPGDVKIRAGGNYFYNFTGNVGSLGSQPTGPVTTTPAQVSPAPVQTQMTETRAQAISQPAQQVPTTINLPPTIIDASPPQQAQQQSGGVSAPPPSGGGSIEVPMLPTTNPDNFLTMYSRIVYNIVDG